MGCVLKLYSRISAVLLIAVVVLALNLWSNKRNRIFEMRTTFRAVGRSENSEVPVLFGGHNLPHLVEIGLTDLPKSGGTMALPAPPGTTPLTLDKRIQDRIPGHEDIRSLERPKIQSQSPLKAESYSTRNLLPSYDNSLDNSRNDQPLQNTRVQQKLIIPKKAEESQTTNVLILSFTRSGGAFLGQLLNNINPDTFYSIDPLPMAVLNQVRPHNLCNAIM